MKKYLKQGEVPYSDSASVSRLLCKGILPSHGSIFSYSSYCKSIVILHSVEKRENLELKLALDNNRFIQCR